MRDAIDGMMAQLLSTGWDGLDPNPEALKRLDDEYREQRRAEAQIVANVLDGEDGARFLDWLARRTIYQPIGEEARAGSERYLIAQAEAQGARNVFFMLLAALQAARGEMAEAEGNENA